jgi:ribosome-binding protein aMBF1 (putative translation factor)
VILCDLCGEAKKCLPKEIEGKEFDICADCWRPFAEKLKGKGRVKKSRETVFLPPASLPEREPEKPKPMPEEPPKILCSADGVN